MCPRSGLAHKACANLCLIGAVPPVFVLPVPVSGSSFLLMANQDSESVTREILDFTATYVETEDEIERRGDLLMFKIEPQTIGWRNETSGFCHLPDRPRNVVALGRL